MNAKRVLLVHYTAPPVVGGVEAVLEAQARVFRGAGFSVGVAAGQGNAASLPEGVELILIPEMDSKHPEIMEISQALENGLIPANYEPMLERLAGQMETLFAGFEIVIVHNILTKHFNLPLTAALVRLQEAGRLGRSIAWCHDFTWSSPHSRSKVHAGYPWDLLRTAAPGVTYVTISHSRQKELAGILGISAERIQVIYNGVDPGVVLGLSSGVQDLANRFRLWEADLVILMPIRVTQAKNIELAIEITAELRRAGKIARVVITGPPDPHDPQNMEYYQGLLDLRRSLGLEEEVRFVYELVNEVGKARILTPDEVGDLLRLADLVFLPSHREGFGMPVLEAGLAGVPVICSGNVPAAQEIGNGEVTLLPGEAAPQQAAMLILERIESDRAARLRRKVRQNLTWQALFERQIQPLMTGVLNGRSNGTGR